MAGMNRRHLLRATAASSMVALGGCTGIGREAGSVHPVSERVTEWPSFRGDQHNTGFARGVPATSAEPNTAWTFEANGPFWGSPVVVNGIVYVGSLDNSVYAIDATTGAKQWSFATDHRVEGTPAVTDDTVYIGSYDMHLYALDSTTGEQRWARDLGGLIRGSPMVKDGTVYIGVGCHNLACAPFVEEAGVSENGAIYALDAESGTTSWQYPVGDEVVSTPTTDGKTLYVGSSDETLYALDVASGEQEWAYDAENMVWSSPALAFNTVYFADWNGLVYALDADSGEERWITDTVSDYISGSVAVDENALYIGNTPYNSLDDPSPNYGTMFKLDRSTGQEQWTFETAAFEIGSSPVVSNERVYFGTHGQTGSENVGVYSLSTSGEQQWYRKIGGEGVGASPVLYDGTLYFAGTDSRIYAIE